ncbi:uncharacterized protein YcfL [Salirhabdus euzebyi]|uniref:Uncharacterized protein YcfL n=1 Tax=Salirhabdus euzebyi TaxID=394506 RepID=A0A841PUG6_9BACI|nr:hypothetical protein [Salirhabdus euzebyi]MBB6452499.1 uncharacterized protein YcfL [Salirhabdus euzebyi]
MKKIKIVLTLFLISLLLIGCSKERANQLELDNVIKQLTTSGVELEEATIHNPSVFGATLNGVVPAEYRTKDNGELYVYVFASKKDLDQGVDEFKEMTETMELIRHSKYVIDNILIFYVNSEGVFDEEVNQEIIEGMESL